MEEDDDDQAPGGKAQAEAKVEYLEDDRQDLRDAFHAVRPRIHEMYHRLSPDKDPDDKHQHPDALVESLSLSSVDLPPMKTALRNGKTLSDKLSDPQLEGVHFMEQTFQRTYNEPYEEYMAEMGRRQEEDDSAKVRDPVTGQYPTIDYRERQHISRAKIKSRPGFFLGDGAGVGKGRQLAGLISEQFKHKRNRHIWISISADLEEDAKRDLKDVGNQKLAVRNLKNEVYSNTKGIDFGDGVLFCTYSSLISRQRAKAKKRGAGDRDEIVAVSSGVRRVDQIIQWLTKDRLEDVMHKSKLYQRALECQGEARKQRRHNPHPQQQEQESREKEEEYMHLDFDGCILFDEAHKAKNLHPEVKGQKPTSTGLVVLELQRRLPHARVVYSSATGVTEPNHLGYMDRIGLWGDDTTFKDFSTFYTSVRDVAMMELIAMHMKRQGRYIARSLSLASCTFDIIQQSIEEGGEELYDRAAKLWQAIFEMMTAEFVRGRHNFIIAPEASDDDLNNDNSDDEVDEDGDKPLVIPWSKRENPASYVRTLYWAAHQRFFRSLTVSLKMESAVKIAKQALDEGKAPIIGLQCTGEAALKEKLSAGRDPTTFQEVCAPRKGVIRAIKRFVPLPPELLHQGGGRRGRGQRGGRNSGDLFNLLGDRGGRGDRHGQGGGDGQRMMNGRLLRDEVWSEDDSAGSLDDFIVDDDEDPENYHYNQQGREQMKHKKKKGKGSGKEKEAVSLLDSSDEDSVGASRYYPATVASSSYYYSFSSSARNDPRRGSNGNGNRKKKAGNAGRGGSSSSSSSSDQVVVRSGLYDTSDSDSGIDSWTVTASKKKGQKRMVVEEGGYSDSDGAGSWHDGRAVPLGAPRLNNSSSSSSSSIGGFLRSPSSSRRGGGVHVHGGVKDEAAVAVAAAGPADALAALMPTSVAKRSPLPRRGGGRGDGMSGGGDTDDANDGEAGEEEEELSPGVEQRHYDEAKARRDGLLQQAAELKFKDNPLDYLIRELGGTGDVAELTGRRTRFITDLKGRLFKETRDDGVNQRERSDFMDDIKRVCIISDAASAGISLHAWNKAQNKKRRVHITLELPWAADKAIQQLGRSHRSNQASGPEYKLLVSTIGGENRFVTSVARRLQTLGALLNGDRQATVGGSWVEDMNFDNEYGQRALDKLMLAIKIRDSAAEVNHPVLSQVELREEDRRALLEYVNGTDIAVELTASQRVKYLKYRRASILVGRHGGKDDGDDDEEEEGASIMLEEELGAVKACTLRFWLMKCGFSTRQQGSSSFGPEYTVRKFLNRMLGLEVGRQETLFSLFLALHREVVVQAKRDSKYDGSIIHLKGSVSRAPGSEREIISESFGYPLYHDQLRVDASVSLEQARDMLEQAEEDWSTDMKTFRNNFKHEQRDVIDTIELHALSHRHMGFYMYKNPSRYRQCVCAIESVANISYDRSLPSTVRFVSPYSHANTLPRSEFEAKYMLVTEQEVASVWAEEKDMAAKEAKIKYVVSGNLVPHYLSIVNVVLETAAAYKIDADTEALRRINRQRYLRKQLETVRFNINDGNENPELVVGLMANTMIEKIKQRVREGDENRAKEKRAHELLDDEGMEVQEEQKVEVKIKVEVKKKQEKEEMEKERKVKVKEEEKVKPEPSGGADGAGFKRGASPAFSSTSSSKEPAVKKVKRELKKENTSANVSSAKDVPSAGAGGAVSARLQVKRESHAFFSSSSSSSSLSSPSRDVVDMVGGVCATPRPIYELKEADLLALINDAPSSARKTATTSSSSSRGREDGEVQRVLKPKRDVIVVDLVDSDTDSPS